MKTEILDEAIAALKSERDRGVSELDMDGWYCDTALCVCGAMAANRIENSDEEEATSLAVSISADMGSILGVSIARSIYRELYTVRLSSARDSSLFTQSELESFKFLQTNDLEFDDAIEYIEAVKMKLESCDEDR